VLAELPVAPEGVAAWLFDTAADPSEQTDVATEHETRRAEMYAALRAQLAANVALRPAKGPAQAPVDAKTMEQLRSLGYAGETSERGEEAP
jgi:hypothetical protein